MAQVRDAVFKAAMTAWPTVYGSSAGAVVAPFCYCEDLAATSPAFVNAVIRDNLIC